MSLTIKQADLEIDTPVDVVGCIDAIDNNIVRGWVYSRSDKPIEITLLVDGKVCEIEVERRERSDVVEHYGESARFSGFVLSPCSSEASLSATTNTVTPNVDVLCNDVRLFLRGASPVPITNVKSCENAGKGLLGSNVDSVNEFCIKGWALPNQASVSDIRVFVNGRIIDIVPIHVERADVTKLFGEKAINSGFEIYLPGYVWELADENGLCSVTIIVNDSIVNKGPIVLEYGDITRWVDTISERDANEDTDFLGLLALEHVKYSNVYNILAERGRKFLDDVASRMRLEEFLQNERKQAVSRSAHAESVSALMLRQAMLELNMLMKDAEGEIYPLVKKVYDKYALRGTAKEWYLNLAIQLTCTTGEFDKLKELSNFRYLDGMQSSSQPHQLALLLPVLVSNGEIEKAIKIMSQIAKNVGKSWLPSVCVAYAISVVQKMELDGNVDIQNAERLRMAFVAVLDRFKADWFSRVHDEILVSTMVSLVTNVGFYTDYHKRYLISSAIRHYGLSPKFWQMMENVHFVSISGDLAYAYSAWKSLALHLAEFQSLSEQGVGDVFEALEYFVNKRNKDAVYAIREIVVNIFNVKGRRLSGFPTSLMQKIEAGDSVEAIRFVAHPSNCLPDEWQRNMMDVSDIVNGIRRLSEYHKSSVYDMQISASQALVNLRQALIKCSDPRNLDRLKDELSNMERKCTMLGTPQGLYLGTDMLVSAYQMSSLSGYRKAGLLMNAIEMVRNAVAECRPGDVMPAPICAAIGRIAPVENDTNVTSLLSEIHSLLCAKFGSKYNHLFAADDSPCFPVSEQAWPQDTIVVIDTSKKEINGRCVSIRQTWLEDLKLRGVPYLFVVGDGCDEVTGDVLELDVSEKWENRPEKTLKTFSWIASHMNVQYVVKVSDECFLNVGLYLDSMSYRKYHYYGKVIRCSQGKMNRRWHQGHIEHSERKKSVDKSLGNVGFVDGGYSISLSRHAIFSLSEMAQSARGKRLRSCEYGDDKLVGDLLSLCNIVPNDEDFDVYTDSPVHHELLPEELYGNGFFPGRFTPGKIAHISHGKKMQYVQDKYQSNEVWPKKIWPTCQKSSLRSNANQLELITETKVLNDLLEENIVVVSVVRNEMLMLPQFLAHYRGLGVKCFIFVDNSSDDGTREFLLKQQDTIVYSCDTDYKSSHFGVSWQQAVMANHCLGKWVLIADADEFLVYEDCESIPLSTFVDGVDSSGDNGVLLYMVDMYPYGDLDAASFNEKSVFEVAPYFDKHALIELRFGGGMYSNSRNYVNGLRHRLAPARINAYVSQKYALFKYYPWVRLCEGAHYAANMQVSRTKAFFAHFKYHSGFKEKVEVEVQRKQHFNGAEEYLKYAEMISEISGGFGAEGVSERYVDSHSFVRLLSRLDGS